ncbi:metallophosphoesterase family protein [Bosea sp. LjRoot9]|uniref:metallophosphoesterase family protein n=1 Tax=Bosea sp. LjRoot9 TaxID=3342341 RepID=UPI003ED13BF1
MRLGVIADVHGNLPALEAVMERLAGLELDAVVNLGDCASSPLWPAESVALLRKSGFHHVRGNHDRVLGAPSLAGLGLSDAYAWSQLDQEARDWLLALPFSLSVAGALCIHASPQDDNTYLLESVVAGRLLPASLEEVEGRLDGNASRLIFCAHSHLPRLLRLGSGATIVNPGSVGCPAYDDPDAPAHVSESGSPHARFALVTVEDDKVGVAFQAIAYDWAAAARRAQANGREDWAQALLKGWMG